MDVVPVGGTLSLVQSYRKWLLRLTQLLSKDCSVRHIATSTPNPTDKILKNYPGMDKGIGRLKNLAVNLHWQKCTAPTYSRILFHNRDKLAKELQHLQEQDIIEKFSGPTKYPVSSLRQNSRVQMKSDCVWTCEMQTRQYPQNGQGFGGFFA